MARKVDKRSRALRRNLRKQARKGTLSAREQQDLLTQEARFRKAARRRRPYTLGIPLGVGAGLGAAALLGGDIFSRLGGTKGDGTPSGDPEQTPKVDPGAEMVPNRATMEEYERLKNLEEVGAEPDSQQPTDDAKEEPTSEAAGPGVGETASEPASDEAAETAEAEEAEDPEVIAARRAALAEAMNDPNALRTDAVTGEILNALPEPTRFDDPAAMGATQVSPRNLTQELLEGLSGREIKSIADLEARPLPSMGPVPVDGPQRLLDYPTYEVPFRELSPKEYRKLSRDEKRAYNDALEEYRFSGPEVVGAFPFRSTEVDAGPSAAEERREALQPELERRRQENATDAALRSAREVASQVDTPNPRRWSYGSPVFREMYPEVRGAFPSTGSSRDELIRRLGNTLGTKEALRPEEGIGLGGVTDYTGGFDVGSATMDPRDGRVAAALGLRPMTDMERVEMLRRGVSANAQRERDAILADQARRAAASQAAGVSGIPYRQAMGGKNPSTAKLMKRIKAKYGMK
jgi:hypothetical protein